MTGMFYTRPGRWLGCLWIMLALVLAGTAQARPLLVEGVEVEVPLPVSGDPRQKGMAMGKEEAFSRLLLRMVATDERNRRRAGLDALRRESAPLAERVMIRSEKQREDRISLVLDVAFAEEGVRRLLEKQSGMAFNTTPYPSVLLLVGDEKTGEVVIEQGQSLLREVAKACALYGIALAKPLDDVDDMVNISWSALRSGDPQLMQWLTARYPAQAIWVVARSRGDKGKDKPQLLLNEIMDGSIKDYRESLPAAGQEEALPVTAKNVVARVVDGWIQSHLVHPSLRHDVSLRLIHGPDLARQAALIKNLRKLPGVKELRFVQLQAWESLIRLEYEGRDELLGKALAGLGLAVENAGDELLATAP